MNTTELQLPITLDELLRILQAHRVVHASIFGSYARGQARPDSDLDILVDYSDQATIFDHLALRNELMDLSGKEVDVVSSKAVSRHLRPFIDKDKVQIL